MRSFAIISGLVCVLAAITFAQDPVLNWVPADSETIPMEPASLHSGRIYRPAVGGGTMHISVESRFPVTIAMAWADEWNNAVQHPEAPSNLSFLCIKEHVVSAIYECHLPSERPMILTIRDERKPERPVVTTIGAILGPGVRQFISPNDLHIQYYRCIQPEFHWRNIVKEKYDVTPAPKIYSLFTPDHDGQELGVQSLAFNCTFNVANGPQTIMVLPDINFSGHKKANVEIETVKCVEHCELLSPPPNP